eukprot:COSAG04_NODE_1047_length_8562_cov_9.403167_4_plen_59_part_00
MFSFLDPDVVAWVSQEHGAVSGSFSPSGDFAKGVITFTWDNSFSKMTAKSVAFKLSFS